MRLRNYTLFLTAFSLLVSACASPIEVARRIAQAGTTPTATPNLTPPALTPPPSANPNYNQGQSVSAETPCSHRSRDESVTTALWDAGRQQYYLVQIDPQNGQPLCGTTTFPLEPYLVQAASPDGKILAAFNYRDEYYQDGSLSLFDIAAWQVYTTTLRVNAQVASIVFNPSNDLMAFSLLPKPGAHGTQHIPLYLFDLKSRTLIDSVILDFVPRFMHFTANGKWLALYGSTQGGDTSQQPASYALLLWTNHLGLAWKQELSILDGSMLEGPKDQEQALVTWTPGLAYAPTRDILYIVSADAEQFAIVDFLSRSIETKNILPPPVSWLDRLFARTAGIAEARAMWGVRKQVVLSGDGKKLFVTGQASSTSSGPNPLGQAPGPLGLQVIDLKTSSQITSLDTKAIDIQISPDGQYLFLTSWDSGVPSTDILLSNTLENVAHLTGQSLIVTHTHAGQVLLLSIQENLNDSQVSLLDYQKLNTLYTWPAMGKPSWLVQ